VGGGGVTKLNINEWRMSKCYISPNPTCKFIFLMQKTHRMIVWKCIQEKEDCIFQISHAALSLSINDYTHSSKIRVLTVRRHQNHPKHLLCHCLLYDRQNLCQGHTFPLLLDPLTTFRRCHRSCRIRWRRKRMLIKCAGADLNFTFRKFRSFDGDLLSHTSLSKNCSIEEVLFNCLFKCLTAHTFSSLGMAFSEVPWRSIG